jgi:hypothetical protein
VESLLCRANPDDPVTLVLVALVLVACSLLAAWGPAQRAAAVQALRLE